MSVPVLLNSLVPLCYLSPYKDVNLYVRARIFDVADNLVGTKDMVHIEEGRYTNATFFMPNAPSLKVRYDIYSDPAYTLRAKNEGSHDERFYLLETPDALIRNDELQLIFVDPDNSSSELIIVEDPGEFEVEFSPDESIELLVGDDPLEMSFTDTNESIELLVEC